jgi:predicted nucleotidyltransferase
MIIGAMNAEHRLARLSPAATSNLPLRIPNLGITIPNMGSHEEGRVRPADALFTKVQQRVLGILFGQPERSFLSKEVISLAHSGTGAVHRELKRLAASGIVIVSSAGWEKHYQANNESPIFQELHALVVKTVGLVEPIREALAPLAERVRFVFVFGSLAKGTEAAASDVDLMIVSDDLSYAEAYTALAGAETVLARTINPTLYSWEEWRKRRETGDHFVTSVMSQPKVFILGTEDDAG